MLPQVQEPLSKKEPWNIPKKSKIILQKKIYAIQSQVLTRIAKSEINFLLKGLST
jgi:hypothetical protein